jgi:hypothetical protein
LRTLTMGADSAPCTRVRQFAFAVRVAAARRHGECGQQERERWRTKLCKHARTLAWLVESQRQLSVGLASALQDVTTLRVGPVHVTGAGLVVARLPNYLRAHVQVALPRPFFCFTACATEFIGEAHYVGGPSACVRNCRKEHMEMDSFVFMGEYSSACVCRLVRKEAQSAQRDDGRSSGSVGAVAGVMTQIRETRAAAGAVVGAAGATIVSP